MEDGGDAQGLVLAQGCRDRGVQMHQLAVAGKAELVEGEAEKEGDGGDVGFGFGNGDDQAAGTEAIAETTDLKTKLHD